jgi:transporter family-2 protein
MSWLLVLGALALGALLPVQAGINARLATFVGGPIRAAVISFGVGMVLIVALSLVVTRGIAGARSGHAPWWAWVGGSFGAAFVAGSTALAPRIGALNLFAAVVLGQAAMSALLDQFGAIGYRQHELGAGRIAGVVLLAAGVALVRIF